MYYKKNSNNSRMRKDFFLWGFVLLLMAAIAVAGVEQSSPEAVGDEAVVAASAAAADEAEPVVAEAAEPAPSDPVEPAPSDVAASAVGESLPGAQIQSLNFKKEMRIPDALQFLGARYQKNIVPSSKVDGMITVSNLYNVTFEDALNAILGYGFRYEVEDNFIKVYTAEEYKQIREDAERKVHRVFTLYYLTAEEAQNLIKPVLSEGAAIQASTAAEKRISAGGGGGGSAGGGGGASGGSGGTGGSLGGGGGGDSLALNDAVVVFDFPEKIAKAEEILKALDVRPKQVLVEATILSARLTEGMDLGVDLNFMAGVELKGQASSETIVAMDNIDRGAEGTSPIGQISDITAGTPIETFGFATAGGHGLRVGISTGDVRAFVSALEAVTDTTVLANPKVLAVNKQEGAVLIGRNLGYRSSTTVSTGGIATEGEVEFLQTGTQLVFRPYIGNDGYIRMDIYPKDSTAELNVDRVPDESTTELRTNIIVRDGETIVLGGLFRDVVASTREQIPLLGDIPIIGAAFRGTSDVTQREEVIILLTPHIIDAAGQTNAEARAADIGRKRYGARKTLQPINRAKIAEEHYVKAVRAYSDGKNVEAMSDLAAALKLRPTYLEALRLKERIIREMSPDEVGQIERIMLGVIEQEEAQNWRRL